VRTLLLRQGCVTSTHASGVLESRAGGHEATYRYPFCVAEYLISAYRQPMWTGGGFSHVPVRATTDRITHLCRDPPAGLKAASPLLAHACKGCQSAQLSEPATGVQGTRRTLLPSQHGRMQHPCATRCCCPLPSLTTLLASWFVPLLIPHSELGASGDARRGNITCRLCSTIHPYS
jgi:hypothetical protein